MDELQYCFWLNFELGWIQGYHMAVAVVCLFSRISQEFPVKIPLSPSICIKLPEFFPILIKEGNIFKSSDLGSTWTYIRHRSKRKRLFHFVNKQKCLSNLPVTLYDQINFHKSLAWFEIEFRWLIDNQVLNDEMLDKWYVLKSLTFVGSLVATLISPTLRIVQLRAICSLRLFERITCLPALKITTYVHIHNRGYVPSGSDSNNQLDSGKTGEP